MVAVLGTRKPDSTLNVER